MRSEIHVTDRNGTRNKVPFRLRDKSAAVAWLEQHSPAGYAIAGITDHHASGNRRAALSVPPTNQTGKLRLPARDASKLPRVRNYLIRRRTLSWSVLQPLIEAGKLYADNRGNAIFLLVAGKANCPVGAELRGTGTRVWRGMAPGTRRDAGVAVHCGGSVSAACNGRAIHLWQLRQ
jgi:hypothetical protein